jgi:hypothetical protein
VGFLNKGIVEAIEDSYIDHIKGKMNRVSPRVKKHNNIHQLIGRVLSSNCFPTMRGKMIYIREDRCFFEMVENDQFPKYNQCAGQIEYLPEYMVVTMDFEEE